MWHVRAGRRHFLPPESRMLVRPCATPVRQGIVSHEQHADTGRTFICGLPLSSGVSKVGSLGGSASEAGRWALQASIKSPTFPRHTRRDEPSLKRAFRAQGRRRWPSSSFLRADGSRGRELLMTLKKP